MQAFKEERLASILSMGGTWPLSRTCLCKRNQRFNSSAFGVWTHRRRDLSKQATLSVSAATTPLAFSKFAIASLHDVDFAIADHLVRSGRLVRPACTGLAVGADRQTCPTNVAYCRCNGDELQRAGQMIIALQNRNSHLPRVQNFAAWHGRHGKANVSTVSQ